MHTVKLLSQDDQAATIGGYGIVFGGRDLDGETFTPDTNFMLDLVPEKPVLYDHSKNKTLGLARLGRVVATRADDVGLWVEAQIDRAHEYADAVLTLVGKGVLGWSSGSVGHMTRREGAVIKTWPIVEFSLTPTPAEPRTVGVERLKQLIDSDERLRALMAEVAGEAAPGAPEPTKERTTIHKPEVQIMSDDTKAVGRDEFDALAGKIDSFSKAMNGLIEKLENAPALKDVGYIAPDSETDHAQAKSLGDYLIAVKRGNVHRLATVYKATKDLAEEGGTTGGFLVPPAYASELLRVNADQSPILARVRRVPVTVDAGAYPVLDQFVTPTAGAGNTALAAGLTSANTAEGGTLTETQATFEQLVWRVSKVGGFVEVTSELMADSPVAIEALLTDLIRININGKLERHILRGSGVGEPLGILNSTAAIGVTTATNDVFAPADALAMLSRFRPTTGTPPVWITHRSIIPDFSSFTSNAADLVNYNNPLTGTLLGYPIIYSEHMPQANGDDVLLADLGAYLLFERQGLQIAYSEHAAFTSDKGTWRFTARIDGKPWMRTPITQADPTGGYTVSPFVYHND